LQWTDWQKQAKSLEGAAACDWTFNFRIGKRWERVDAGHGIAFLGMPSWLRSSRLVFSNRPGETRLFL
jgi:hypothetical protein